MKKNIGTFVVMVISICFLCGNGWSAYASDGIDDTVIAVGGIDQNYDKPGFSNYGDWIDIVAPATDFVVATEQSDNAYSHYNVNGTSFAAPLVTATVGLMISVNPDLTPEQVRNTLYGASDPLPASEHDYKLDSIESDYCYVEGEVTHIYYYVCSECGTCIVLCKNGHVYLTGDASEKDLINIYYSCGSLNAGAAVQAARLY
ncbi:MAG: S8 family serine peptidase [Lachnospiraceae bacterium]|nr:S8 family serine peptidase [Lachnospiraceae bacterium]